MYLEYSSMMLHRNINEIQQHLNKHKTWGIWDLQFCNISNILCTNTKKKQITMMYLLVW